MLLEKLFKNRYKRRKFAHIGAGVVILIHCYEKYEHGHSSYILFGISGLVFLSIAAFHHPLEKKFPWVDGVFFVIEGILSIIVAIDFLHLGKKALPLAYLLLAGFQFFMAFRKSKKGIEHKKNQINK